VPGALPAGLLSDRIDAQHEIAHNKVMILDDEIVITGSFNFTHNAEERNAENLLIIHGKELAARYTANWQEHCKHSVPYDDGALTRFKKTEHATARNAIDSLH
jgi:phosphatidylserine/phosphatidylglycerophosphate/cardiolipin synthase-like enzyme